MIGLYHFPASSSRIWLGAEDVERSSTVGSAHRLECVQNQHAPTLAPQQSRLPSDLHKMHRHYAGACTLRFGAVLRSLGKQHA